MFVYSAGKTYTIKGKQSSGSHELIQRGIICSNPNIKGIPKINRIRSIPLRSTKYLQRRNYQIC